MEFLGDAVLGLVVGEFLYMRFPEDEEGELQKKRAALVNRTALARLARELDLGQFIRMGRGDDLSGLRNLDSVLSDTLEAIVAAVYLDGGIDAAHRMIGRHFGPLIEGISTCGGNGDFKSALQELAQARLKVTPTYRLLETWGEDHCRTFAVAVCLGDEIAGQGTGGSKREAAQDAARDALTRLGAYLGIG
jgi:ribonuclease III